ncbi:MAG: ArnT family glycosyltransferase [Pseudonocardiaceae bacterium]
MISRRGRPAPLAPSTQAPVTTVTGALPRFAWGPVGVVVVVQVALLTVLSGRYGFHRDELYFLAAGDHPAWGYVDQPPLTPLLAWAVTALFGDSPSGLRVASTLIGAATVVVTALAAREFGGGHGAQLLTAAGTALSTYVLVVTHMVSTASTDLLVWTVVGLLVLRVLRSGNGRWWLAVGAAVGVGLLNKWLVLLLVAALGASVLAVGPRRVLRSGWLAAGVGIALLLAAPTLVWQASHGWPQLTVATGISAPGGKPYYAVPVLLVLVAAGAEPTLRWLGRGRARRAAVGAATVLSVAVSVLIGLPVLPADRLGPVLAVNKESGEQVGWPRFVDTVADAWRQVPPGQRPTAVIFTRNYGQAGAIERYGPARGLPRPYSGHMAYADWGPPPDDMAGPVLLVGRVTDAGGQHALRGCRVLARHDNGAGVDNEEQGTPITLCTRLAAPWSALWPTLRHYY